MTDDSKIDELEKKVAMIMNPTPFLYPEDDGSVMSIKYKRLRVIMLIQARGIIEIVKKLDHKDIDKLKV